MLEAAPDLVRRVLPAHLDTAAVELAPYFADSFGNATRIDYGTGRWLGGWAAQVVRGA